MPDSAELNGFMLCLPADLEDFDWERQDPGKFRDWLVLHMCAFLPGGPYSHLALEELQNLLLTLDNCDSKIERCKALLNSYFRDGGPVGEEQARTRISDAIQTVKHTRDMVALDRLLVQCACKKSNR